MLDQEVTDIQSDSLVTPLQPGLLSSSSLSSQPRPPISGTDGGLTTLVATYQVSAMMNVPPAGSNLVSSLQSFAFIPHAAAGCQKNHGYIDQSVKLPCATLCNSVIDSFHTSTLKTPIRLLRVCHWSSQCTGISQSAYCI